MLKEYRNKETIQAERFDGSKKMMDEYEIDEVSSKPGKELYAFETVEGPFWLHVGDWIATNDDGLSWVINDDWFRSEYEEVE